MKKFTVTEARQLAPGDRFYFFTDKKRMPHTVHGKGKLMHIGFVYFKLIRYDYLKYKGIEMFKDCRPGTRVVFLRHSN